VRNSIETYDSNHPSKLMSASKIIGICSLFVGLIVIFSQFSQNSRLKKKLKTLEVEFKASGGKGINLSSDFQVGPSGKGGSAREGSDKTGTGKKNPIGIGTVKEILADRDPLNRVQRLMSYVNGLSPKEMPEALIALQESAPQWDPHMKMAVGLLLTRWAAADSNAAFAHVEQMKDKGHARDATFSILRALASQDPQRALEWMSGQGKDMAKDGWMGHALAGTIASEWVRQDPDAALAWANSLPKNQRQGALGGALETIAASNPVEAAQRLLELDPGEAREKAAGNIDNLWAKRAPQEAMEWAMTLEGDDKESAMSKALGGWASSEPDEAASFINGIPVEERTDSQVREVGRRWASQEPSKAAQWLIDQPDSSGRTDAVGYAMWHWTNEDPGGAADWILEQPRGDFRDNGIASIAKATFEEDPSSAVTWAATIDNDKQREGAIERGVREWAKREPDQARDWVQKNSNALSPEQSERLLNLENRADGEK